MEAGRYKWVYDIVECDIEKSHVMEIIVEVYRDWYDLKKMHDTMLDLPDWGEDIPLDCAGFETQFYMKD